MPEQEHKKIISDHLAQKSADIKSILKDVGLTQQDFDLMLGLISAGGIDIADLPEYFVSVKPELTLDQASKLQTNFYNRVLIDVSDEIDIQRKAFVKLRSEIVVQHKQAQVKAAVMETVNPLKNQYQEFLKTKLVEAVVKSQDREVSLDEAKAQFYAAINEKEREKFLISAAKLFSSGKIEELFRKDERYNEFWRQRVLQAEGLDRIHRFDENPARPEYISGFLKYVLEQRFNVSQQRSPLWGAYLSALAKHAGDEKYEKLAYGDIGQGEFVWHE